MKIVHGLGWYLPESIGGTEVYVQGLCRELQQRGVEVVVMAPCDGEGEDEYEHEGVCVVRYPVPRSFGRDQLEGRAPHARFEVFERRLREQRGDVFHLHSLTTGSGAHHLEAARRAGMRTVMTAHVPGIVCARGTMLRFGREVCDGRIDPRQCVPCWLAWKSVPHAVALPAAALLQRVPRVLGELAPGPAGTVLRTPARIDAARATLLELASRCDRIVAVCAWLRDALLANGVAESKLLFCRQGVPARVAGAARGPAARTSEQPTLRIGYFGRIAHIKGLDVLVRALRGVPEAVGIELRIHAPAVRDGERAYEAEVRALAAGDARIQFRGTVASDAVHAAMRECDVVAVPSRWLETGPLVAMEALAAGIPVIGSNRGGLAELIEPGVTGWLVAADDAGAWTALLERLARGGARLTWDPARTPVSTTAEVAARMHALYSEVCA